MMEILKNTKIDFIVKRKYAFILSTVLVTAGIFAFVMIMSGKANLGIDFAGGAMIMGNFEKPVSSDHLRMILTQEGFDNIEIQQVEGENVIPNSFILKTVGASETLGDSLRTEVIMARIDKNFPDNNFHIDSVDDIGGAVGKTLREKATWAILFSLMGILAYIWIRFDFRFGVAATIATFHDVLAVLGIYYFMGREVSLLLVTSLLTIAGYSLTDTVVVFDRIRENLKLYRKRGDFAGTFNTSINEVLSRTIITSATTLIAVLAILFFGGDVLRDFAIALIVGIFIGTYSSVFVASPIVVEWENRSPRRFK